MYRRPTEEQCARAQWQKPAPVPMAPRRFELGFTTSFEGIESFCEQHGYLLVRDRAWYALSKLQEPGKPRLMKWNGVLEAIDDIRVGLGLEPIRRRGA